MSLHYEELDERTRQFMLQELKLDIANDRLYVSPRLNGQGVGNWSLLFRDAIERYDDAWLAKELKSRVYMKTHEQRRKPKGGYTTAKVPVTAPETLAEGEFNRFYVRGLCARALSEGVMDVEVYRGKEVAQPRRESEVTIGKRVSAQTLLDDLRVSQGVEPALGIPPGPNSGLTVRLP